MEEEMARNKGWRLLQARKLQKKRLKDIQDWYSSEDPRHLGHFKNNHLGCSCPSCKPWKHKREPKYTVSERRRLQDD